MPLPKQIQAQLAEMEAFDQQVAADRGEEPKPIGEPPLEPTPPGEVEQPKPISEPPPEEATWKQRYLSLQGQYNSQVPTLQMQVAQLTDRVTQMTSALQAKPPEQKPQEQTLRTKAELVTAKDVDAFGEDLVDLARRVAKDEFGGRETEYHERIQRLEAQLSEAQGQVGEVAQSQAQSVSERFFTDLNNAVPGWEQVQATPECQEFLASRIPGTGQTWDVTLKNAAKHRDISAVQEVFGTFFERHPALDQRAKQPVNRRAELSRQVTPTRSAASTGTPTQGKRTYTGDQYAAEMMRVVRLRQASKWDESARLEADLNVALAERRVVP